MSAKSATGTQSRRPKAAVSPAASESTCIIPSCGDPRHLRGLCSRCYCDAQVVVARTGISWEQLERLGMALSAEADSPFFAELRRQQRKRLSGAGLSENTNGHGH